MKTGAAASGKCTQSVARRTITFNHPCYVGNGPWPKTAPDSYTTLRRPWIILAAINMSFVAVAAGLTAFIAPSAAGGCVDQQPDAE
jgi:hypothetical protein